MNGRSIPRCFMLNVLDFLHANPFYELTALLMLAAATGLFGILLKQPMVVTFIVVGILAGPSILGIVQSHENIDVLAKLGVSLLLFMVGLKLDIKLIRTLGPVALATGIGQVIFTSVLGTLIGLAMGYDFITATYIGIALTFSSTIIIIKLLSDKKEVNLLHGKVALGMLIVQDIIVVFAMMMLSAIGIRSNVTDNGSLSKLVTALGSTMILFTLLWAFTKFLATTLMRKVTRSAELIIIFVISWACLLSSIGHELGFGIELGGLLAGITLASTPFREAVVTKLSPLRDFLLLFFFINLGSQLNFSHLEKQILPSVIFSLFVLIGNPIIVMVIMGIMGYRKRTGFLTGLTVAQISEFSLIFITMGMQLNHVGEETLGLVTLVGLITIAMSVYMITYSHLLFRELEPFLNFFERQKPIREITAKKEADQDKNYDVILFGLGRYGKSIAQELVNHGLKVLGVDYNPDVVRQWHLQGCDVQYGDAHDHEYFESLPLTGVKWILAATPEHDLGITHEDTKHMLLTGLRRMGFGGKIGVSTYDPGRVKKLIEKGADVVFLPYEDAAHVIAEKVLEQELPPPEEMQLDRPL